MKLRYMVLSFLFVCFMFVKYGHYMYIILGSCSIPYVSNVVYRGHRTVGSDNPLECCSATMFGIC